MPITENAVINLGTIRLEAEHPETHEMLDLIQRFNFNLKLEVAENDYGVPTIKTLEVVFAPALISDNPPMSASFNAEDDDGNCVLTLAKRGNA